MISSNSRVDRSPRRVAVVLDSDATARNALVAQLAGLGCRALGAGSLAEARRLVADESPALVFVACTEFVAPGADIAAELMPEVPRPAQVPRVVTLCDTCTGCGAEAVLPKPVPLDAVQRLLGSGSDRPAPAPGVATALRDLDPEVLGSLLQVFEDDTSDRLRNIAAALQAADLHRVDREAHAVKSGSLQIGADAMAGCCEELRAAARDGNLGLARQAYDELVLSFCETMAVSTPIR